MISTRHRFIYLHVPRTAGNAVQSWLLPFSDDSKVVHPGQDGVERYDVQGAVTSTKHATLEAYRAALGAALADYAIVMPVRDPLDRALSLYFSPQRGVGRPAGFVPAFKLAAFSQLIDAVPSMADFLRIDGRPREPDLVVRFERLQEGLAAVAQRFGLLSPTLPSINRSLDAEGRRREELAQDPEVVAAALRRFGEDYDLFGYPRPTA